MAYEYGPEIGKVEIHFQVYGATFEEIIKAAEEHLYRVHPEEVCQWHPDYVISPSLSNDSGPLTWEATVRATR